jgi:TRAP-type C4-dicarboxylate transport system substrate-binding protein
VTGFTISIFLLKDKWDALPDKVKAAFWDAAKWYEQNSAPMVNKKYYPETYWPRIQKAGIQVINPTEAELKDFEEKSKPVWEWWKKQVGEAVGQKAIDLSRGLS